MWRIEPASWDSGYGILKGLLFSFHLKPCILFCVIPDSLQHNNNNNSLMQWSLDVATIIMSLMSNKQCSHCQNHRRVIIYIHQMTYKVKRNMKMVLPVLLQRRWLRWCILFYSNGAGYNGQSQNTFGGCIHESNAGQHYKSSPIASTLI